MMLIVHLHPRALCERAKKGVGLLCFKQQGVCTFLDQPVCLRLRLEEIQK
jgi:hypothetical protein